MRPRKIGIDYLRAIMSVFVVFWHMGGGGTSLIFSKDRYLEHAFTVSDFVNFHLLLLAVPTFIFISIYLYAMQPVSASTLGRRFKRHVLLLTFWPIALVLYDRGYRGLVDGFPDSAGGIVRTILAVGWTPYYFFISLLICLVAVHLFLLLGRKLQVSLLCLSVALLVALPQLTKVTGFYPLSAYWSPLNFIPFAFAAALFARHEDGIMKKKYLVLGSASLLCALCAVLEWKYAIGEVFFSGQAFALPAYTRASLLFAVVIIFVLALKLGRKAYKPVSFMAKYSLGLYCLHVFAVKPVQKGVSAIISNETAGLYVAIVLVLVVSYFVAWLLRRYYVKEEIIV